MKIYREFSANWFHDLLRKAYSIPPATPWSTNSDLHKTAKKMADLTRDSSA